MEKLILIILLLILVGCEAEPMEVEISYSHPSHYLSSDGSVGIDANGGTGNYSVSLNGQKVNQPINDLKEGTYQVMVADGKDNVYQETIHLYAPLEVTFEVKADLIDFKTLAELHVIIHGGKLPYEIMIDGQKDKDLMKLQPGDYELRVVDALGTEGVHLIHIAEIITTTINDHEGNTYNVKKFNDQWWMIDNIKLEHALDGTPIDFSHYNDDVSISEEYGYLYNYENALKLEIEGWHLATHEDFMALEKYLGMSEKDANKIGSSSRGTDMGIRLQVIGDIGFNGQLAGWFAGEHGYGGLDEGVAYITASLDPDGVIVRTLMKGEGKIFCYPDPLDWRFYARFVKDQ